MPFKIKKAGSYSDPVATKIKLSGAYQAVQGIFCKVAGAYQSVLSSIPPNTYITNLFSSGEQGCWYDPSDLSTMWQDSAGTTPVTAAGQPVGKILDKSGRGNHATQATAGSRPTLEVDGSGAYYLSFSGSQSLATVAFTGVATDKATLHVVAMRNASTGSTDNNTICTYGTFSSQTGAFTLSHYNNHFLVYRRASGSFGAGESINTLLPVQKCITVALDFSGSTHLTEQTAFRINGTDERFANNYGATDTGSGNFANRILTLGFNATTGNLTGRIYQFVLRFAASDATQISNAETYVAYKSGIGSMSLSNTYAPSAFSRSAAPIDRGSYLETSTFGSAEYTTSATLFEINSYNNIRSTFSTYTEIGVLVNGVHFTKVNPSADGVATHYVQLPSGNKTVSFVNGLRSKPASSIIGTFVTSLKSNAPMTQINTPQTGGLLIYGDSIASGADAANATTKSAWAMQVREAYSSNNVTVESYGYRAFHDDASDSTKRAAFVSNISAYSPAKIWLAIGTNDYGLNKWSAASFGAAYASLLDDLHAALPSATIYCQTPILRTTETANGSGSTMGDYRTQINAAASARSSYCTYIDGTAFMTTASLTDGVHPSAAGHTLYAAAVKTVLGI